MSWDLSRWCGLAAMVGGVLWAAQNVLVLAIEQIRWTEGVFLVALLLVLGGVVGFHFLQEGRYGLLGRGYGRSSEPPWSKRWASWCS